MIGQTRDDLRVTAARMAAYRQQKLAVFALGSLAWIALAAMVSLWGVSHFITREITRANIEREEREKLMTRLMESNTELECFAYVASHDLQEPLRMVNAFSQLLANDYGSKLDDTGRQYLCLVGNSAARMHLMVQDLLQYSRLKDEHEANDVVDLGVELDNVRGEFRAAYQHLRGDHRGEGPARHYRESGSYPASAWQSDRQRHQPKGQVPHITISGFDRDDHWLITVKDNGLGVLPDFAARIFEPFRRLHTWGQFEGSGLGLSICRKIVERHHGRIWVEPQARPGACFCFTLPKRLTAPDLPQALNHKRISP